MGSDNLFHKRKAKNNQRKGSFRKEYDKVLIVCEDSKSAPNYFIELVSHFEISSANVKVDGSCGSSPKCVFEYAERLFNEEKRKGDSYDRVYCVIDKDSHGTYDETILKVRNKKYFYLANSVPCFEYWILLHFKDTTSPYSKKGKSSIANEVLKDLKNEMPQYAKGSKNIFKDTLGYLNTGIFNAKRSLKQAQLNNTDNPSTNVHELVEYLKNIKKANS